MSPHLLVHAASARCLVQDRGRPGWAHLGVPRSGALDAPAAALANRLVGNAEDAAVLEVLLGGIEVEASIDTWVAVTGAPAPVDVDGRAVAHSAALRLRARARLRIDVPTTGLRSYLAIGGGLVVDPVLGSRSTDTLAGVGPPPVTAGAVLPLARGSTPPRALDSPRLPRPGPLRVDAGPRSEWCGPTAETVLAALCAPTYVVREESDRVGMRLDGPALPRRAGELPSEGMVLGAVQVPPDGRPVVFLADHPSTGGYPVVAVVRAEDLWRCAQLRPGETVRFSRS